MSKIHLKKKGKSFEKHICLKCVGAEPKLEVVSNISLSVASCQICGGYMVGAKAKHFKK